MGQRTVQMKHQMHSFQNFPNNLTFPPTMLQTPSLSSSISEADEVSIDNRSGGS